MEPRALEDIRITKTHRALFAAMKRLMGQVSFKKISVMNLCEQASVGRATFYAHFEDKYQFLRMWLKSLDKEYVRSAILSCGIEGFTQHACRKAIANMLADADFETMMIVSEYLQELFCLQSGQKPLSPRQAEAQVFAEFFGSGMLGLLIRQSNHYGTLDATLLQRSLSIIIDQFCKWNNDRESCL